jgi:hypothetical protein
MVATREIPIEVGLLRRGNVIVEFLFFSGVLGGSNRGTG